MAGGGVNVKMGVSGVAQFKQSINQAKQNIKTLDAQLSLTEKQFKATGDAETYMQQKSEQLKAKMEEQQRIIEQTSSALNEMASKGDTSSKAYQQMIQQLATAKGDLIDTEQALAGVSEQAVDAGNDVDHMNYQLKRIGEGVNYENVTNALGKISGGMEKVMKKAIDLGKKIVSNVLGAGSWADDLHTRAAYYEMTDEELQRAEKTAQIIDTPVEAIINAQKKLRKGIGSADKGVMGAFAELFGKGYDPNVKGWENAFWDAGQAIMKFGDAEEKEVYAQKLFGRSWNELIPLFEAGREEYDKLNKSWNVVPQDQIDALTKMDDQYQKLQGEIDTLNKTFMGGIAPAVEGTMKTITGLLEKFNEYLASEDGQEMMQALSDAVSSLFEDVANIDPDKAMETITGIIDKLKEGLEWISEKKQDVVTAVEAFVGAWALLKVSSGVATFLKLLNGIKGLTASSAATAGASAGASWAGAFASAAMKAAPFLAFLYTLLNPSDASDEIGNNTLIGPDGKPTKEAEEYGYSLNDKGELIHDLSQANPKFVDPGFLKARQEMERQEKEAQLMATLTPAQIQAAQDFWDEYRKNPADFTEETWNAFEGACAGQENLFEALNNRMDEIVQGVQDNSWQAIEDLPESMFMDVASPVQDAAGDISDAADKMGSLPQKVANAVRGAVSGMSVVLNGDGLAQAVGQILAGAVENG